MPGSVQAALRALLGAGEFAGPVREVMLAGGCNCSRVSLVGACLGAQFGLEGIPREWMEKTHEAKRGLSLAIQLVKL